MQKAHKEQMRLTHEKATMERLQAYMEQDAELKAFLTKPLGEMEGGYRSVVASVLSVKMDTYRRHLGMRDKVTPVYFDPANAKTIFDILEELFGPHNVGDIRVEFLITGDGKLIGCVAYTVDSMPMGIDYRAMLGVDPYIKFVNDVMLISFMADTNWEEMESGMKQFVKHLCWRYCFVCIVPVDDSSAKDMLAAVFTQHNAIKNISIEVKRSNFDGRVTVLNGYAVLGGAVPCIANLLTRYVVAPCLSAVGSFFMHLYFSIMLLIEKLYHHNDSSNEI